MIPKKIYLNYVEEEDFDNGAEITWCVDPVYVAGCEMQNREYIDLSQVWHPAEEEPEKDRWVISKDKYGKIAVFKWDNQIRSWNGFASIFELRIWAYADDLIPKGGDQ